MKRNIDHGGMKAAQRVYDLTLKNGLRLIESGVRGTSTHGRKLKGL